MSKLLPDAVKIQRAYSTSGSPEPSVSLEIFSAIKANTKLAVKLDVRMFRQERFDAALLVALVCYEQAAA